MAVEVNARPYRRNHWNEPKGRGMWLFDLGRREKVRFAFTGTYTEARKAAVAEAKRLGLDLVEVLP